MTAIVIDNIGELTTNDDEVPVRRNAAIVLEGGRVAWVGDAADAPVGDERVDAAGRAVLPGWVDSHSHLVFAGDRTQEFEARVAGQPYTAGGILSTVRATRAATDAELEATIVRLRAEALRQGTTFMETKTGYSLDVDGELRSARLAAGHADDVTFLGAHVVGPGRDADEYVDEVIRVMLPRVAEWVRWVDVFCEQGAFGPDHARAILSAAVDAGLGTRIHANQLTPGEGVQIGVELGSASVDHCNHLSDADVDALSGAASREGGPTVATLVPGCDVSTRQSFAPARRLVDAGVPIALATDCNPGTSFTTSMSFCVATAVLQMGLSVREAIFAATAGGALALRRTDIGRLTVGARADVQIIDAPSVTHIAYRPGVPLTTAVFRAGIRVS